MRAVANRVVFPRFVITARAYAISRRLVFPSIAKNTSCVMTIVFTRGVSRTDIARPGTTTSWRITLATRSCQSGYRHAWMGHATNVLYTNCGHHYDASYAHRDIR